MQQNNQKLLKIKKNIYCFHNNNNKKKSEEVIPGLCLGRNDIAQALPPSKPLLHISSMRGQDVHLSSQHGCPYTKHQSFSEPHPKQKGDKEMRTRGTWWKKNVFFIQLFSNISVAGTGSHTPPYTNNWLRERVTSDFPMAAAGGSWDCSYCYTTQLGLSQIQEKDGMVDIQVNKSEMCLPPSNYFDSYC